MVDFDQLHMDVCGIPYSLCSCMVWNDLVSWIQCMYSLKRLIRKTKKAWRRETETDRQRISCNIFCLMFVFFSWQQTRCWTCTRALWPNIPLWQLRMHLNRMPGTLGPRWIRPWQTSSWLGKRDDFHPHVLLPRFCVICFISWLNSELVYYIFSIKST